MPYQQGPWPGNDQQHAPPPVPGSSPAQISAPPGARLLLHPPNLLNDRDALHTKVASLVAVLKGAGWTGARNQTFTSSRNGTASQIGQEWCEVVKQATSRADHGDDMDGQRHSNLSGSGTWGDQSQWMWNAGPGMGQMDGGHGGFVGGDAFGPNTQMVNPHGMSNSMLGMH